MVWLSRSPGTALEDCRYAIRNLRANAGRVHEITLAFFRE
jgi:hypothetical protein